MVSMADSNVFSVDGANVLVPLGVTITEREKLPCMSLLYWRVSFTREEEVRKKESMFVPLSSLL